VQKQDLITFVVIVSRSNSTIYGMTYKMPC